MSCEPSTAAKPPAPSNDDNTSAAERTVARIANQLGCTVDDLRRGSPLSGDALQDLLTSWASITSKSDRARLLEFARRLAKN